MVQMQSGHSQGFGSNLSRLGKKLLIIYTVIYVIELICEHWIGIPIVKWLILYPVTHPDFRIWQIVTHPFIQNPFSPLIFVFSCLGFYFFASPIEYHFGTKRFLQVFYMAALAGALCGELFSFVEAFSMPFMGMLPSILALVVIFGFINPEATILLMFILPVKAKYLSYGTILITVLTFLAKANVDGAYHLGGILFGVWVTKGSRLINIDLIHLKYLEWQMNRKKSRFKIYNGGKDDNDKPPTIH